MWSPLGRPVWPQDLGVSSSPYSVFTLRYVDWLFQVAGSLGYKPDLHVPKVKREGFLSDVRGSVNS